MRSLICFVMGIAVMACTGCGPKLVDIHGKVTYNGQPPGEEGMNITFVGSNRTEVIAPISAAGEYHAQGVVAGPNNIVVFYHDPLWTNRGYVSKSKYTKLPRKYMDINKPVFTFDATEGGVFDVDLTGPVLK